MKKGLFFALALVGFFLFNFNYSISYAFNGLGYSEISTGMAGSGAALPEDALIAAVNPAGMVFVGHRADLGLGIYFPDFTFRASEGEPGIGRIILPPGRHQNLINIFGLPDFGFNYMLDPISSVGVSLYTLYGFGATYKTFDNANINGEAGPGIYGDGTTRDMFRQAITSLTYARKITENSSWGLSLLLAAQTFKIDGVENLSALTERGVMGLPVNWLSNNRTDYSFGAGIQGGFMAKILPRITIAASYQPKIGMSKFKVYEDLFANHGSLNIPASGLLGLTFEAAPNVFFNFDFHKFWYSDVASYSRGDQSLVSGLCFMNPETCLGGKYGASFGWHNMNVFKFGVQWQFSPEWIWRAGFNHADSVIPQNQLIENILAPGAAIENVFTVGFSHLLPHSQQVNGFILYVPSQSITGINMFSGNTQTLRIHVNGIAFGVSWSWIFA